MRLHHHDFMKNIYAYMKESRLSNHRNPLNYAIDKLTNGIRLLCVDEFEVLDVADAMILEKIYEMKISTKNRSIYKNIGGNPHLDNNYTVFGQVVKWMNVVDEINKSITNGQDRPINDVFLTVKVL